MAQLHPPEVFTPLELARAAGVSELEVQALLEAGAIAPVAGATRVFIAHADAVRAGRMLASGQSLLAGVHVGGTRQELFARAPGAAATARTPFAVSTAVHAALVALVILATTLGWTRPVHTATEQPIETSMRLVFLALPGPGGGGGGGGMRKPTPPPRAERKGKRSLSSPLPARQSPPEPRPVEQPREPEPPKAVEPLPEVEAPVVTAPADESDRAGVLDEAPPREDSRGPGSDGGVGSGSGTGIGEGEGSGIGEGSGGGTGGGPYRPGSGIDPPSLLREVKPDYTESARRQGVEGDVVMEIVVQRDGSVGDVRVLQGLGHGLDERAVQAVRQWRFTPARRRGAPVDVLVEVAMEFKLR